MNTWTKHFKSLATPSINQTFDSYYFDMICIELESILNIHDLMKKFNVQDFIFTRANVRTAIKKLNTEKSPDMCGLTTEHVQYASESVVPQLTELFNSFVEHRYIPDFLKVELLTPVFKNKGGKTNPCNYRVITVSRHCSRYLKYYPKAITTIFSSLFSISFKEN